MAEDIARFSKAGLKAWRRLCERVSAALQRGVAGHLSKAVRQHRVAAIKHFAAIAVAHAAHQAGAGGVDTAAALAGPAEAQQVPGLEVVGLGQPPDGPGPEAVEGVQPDVVEGNEWAAMVHL